jgi:hypothetical protein
MRLHRRIAIAAFIVAMTAPGFAGFRFLFWRKPQVWHDPRKRQGDKKLEIADLAVATASQKCENWAWAASLETVLKRQKVELGQDFWVMKADGGEVCKDSIPAPEGIAKIISGDYTLDNGNKVTLQASAVSGAPVSLDAMIDGPMKGRPLILIWKGHPYLYRGMTFDELIAPNGQRDIEVHKLELLDPFESGDKQSVEFDRTKDAPDDPNDIGGVIDVIATFEQKPNWLNPAEELDHPPEVPFPPN